MEIPGEAAHKYGVVVGLVSIFPIIPCYFISGWFHTSDGVNFGLWWKTTYLNGSEIFQVLDLQMHTLPAELHLVRFLLIVNFVFVIIGTFNGWITVCKVDEKLTSRNHLILQSLVFVTCAMALILFYRYKKHHEREYYVETTYGACAYVMLSLTLIRVFIILVISYPHLRHYVKKWYKRARRRASEPDIMPPYLASQSVAPPPPAATALTSSEETVVTYRRPATEERRDSNFVCVEMSTMSSSNLSSRAATNSSSDTSSSEENNGNIFTVMVMNQGT